MKNLAEILLSYKKTRKPRKRPRARPATKQPPKKKAKLQRVRSSKRLKKMRRRSRLPEMRRRSRLPEMMTMKTKLRRHRFQTEGHCRGHGSCPTIGPVGSVERSADSEVAPLANRDTQRHPAAEDQTGPCRYNPFGPCRLQACRVGFRGGVLCCGPKLRNGGRVQKRGGSGVHNRWRASSKCQEEESEGKEAKEEVVDANEEWWQARRRRCRRGRQRGYGKERRGCSTRVRQ